MSGLVVFTRPRKAAVLSSGDLTGAPVATLWAGAACCCGAPGAGSTFCAWAEAETITVPIINIAPVSAEPLRRRDITTLQIFKIRL